MAQFLMRAGKIGLLSTVVNADRVREIRAARTAAYVVAETMIQFTK